ncbi:MAG TPA: response regulator [Candidatus Saccharimonadales bacterium]|nr:response regulator [Candidatus Saccharimonadales bacterium]
MEISPNPIKVLCIEDEEFISELYKRALKKEGYDVRLVKGGAEGLELAKTGEYDIMLLDLMIPDILGIEVLKRLRHEAPNIKTKIIITTNLEQSDEVREEIERQADGYLIKAEITPKQLVVFLNNLKTT